MREARAGVNSPVKYEDILGRPGRGVQTDWRSRSRLRHDPQSLPKTRGHSLRPFDFSWSPHPVCKPAAAERVSNRTHPEQGKQWL